MITCLEAQIHRRFYDKNDVESNVLYAEATILDPRFKRSVQKRLRGHRIRRHQYGRNLTKKLPHLSRVCNPVAAGIVELDKYIQEPLLSRTENPLTWWQDRRPVYPILYSYILKRLSQVATSVPCERTFSKAIIDQKSL